MKKLSIDEIAMALGADEVIPLKTPASAGPLAVAAEANAIRLKRLAEGKAVKPEAKPKT